MVVSRGRLTAHGFGQISVRLGNLLFEVGLDFLAVVVLKRRVVPPEEEQRERLPGQQAFTCQMDAPMPSRMSIRQSSRPSIVCRILATLPYALSSSARLNSTGTPFERAHSSSSIFFCLSLSTARSFSSMSAAHGFFIIARCLLSSTGGAVSPAASAYIS